MSLSDISKAEQILLKKIGVETASELLFTGGTVSAIGMINGQLYTALDNFSSAENRYHKCLIALESNVQKQREAIENGMNVDPSWIAQASAQATKEAESMKAAVEQILLKSAIRELIIAGKVFPE